MALKAAVIAGNRDAFQSLLKQGTDVNTPDALGRTPLSWAAQYGQEEFVRILLKIPEVKPNFPDNCLRGPLSWAAQYGHNTVVNYILERFSNDEMLLESDSPDINGRTPLSYTAGARKCPNHSWPSEPNQFPFPFQEKDIADWTNNNLPESQRTQRAIIANLLLEAKANSQSRDKHGQTPLHWAVIMGKRGLVTLYLQRLVNLHLQDDFGPNHRQDAKWLLSLTISHAFSEGVRELLSNINDVDLNAKNNSGETPLCFALKQRSPRRASSFFERKLYPLNSQKDSEATVKALLQHPKIDPNRKNNSGETPLCLSIRKNYEVEVKELLTHSKIDPNMKDNLGRTPLLLAIEFEHESIVKELLQHPDIDCHSQDKNGRTPAWMAVESGCVELAKLLFDRAEINPDFRNQSGQTPLSYAAKHGNERLVEFLLTKETVDPDSKDENGCTPLLLAVQYGHEEAVKVLLDPNKNRGKIAFDSRNDAGRTPLSYAAYRGDVRVVGLLLETGCVEPNIPIRNGRTPLSLAAKNGHQEIVELLTRNGANPDFRDKGGRTPLAWAIEGVSEDGVAWSIVSHLLKNGSNLDSKDSENRMLLERAVEKGFDRVALELLSEMKFHDRTPLSWASEIGNETIVELLLAQDATEVDSEDRGGRTALWRAADARQESVMKLLAPKDNTTLTVLVQEGNELGARFMLGTGCKVNMTDPLDRTLLHVAALHRQYRLLEDIIKAGVDINAKDSDEKTAIRLAVEEQETEAIKILLKFSAETELIMADQWSHAYQKVDTNAIHPHAIHLLQRECGAEAPRFFGKSIDLEKPEVGNAKLRQIFIFENVLPWKSHWIPDFEWNWPHRPTVTSTAQKLNPFTPRQRSHSSSRYLVSTETKKDSQQWTTFTLVALAPSGEPKQNDNFLEGETWETVAITWTMLPIRNNQRTSGWISIDYFSMLRNGWIPKDNVEFVAHFVSSLNEKWLHLCDRADEHLARRRADQLEKKGLSNKLINHLAEDALAWTQLRNILKDQTHALNTFASEHCRRYSKRKGLQDMQQIIRNLSEAVETRLDPLDQTVRDLLQLEFAWVSVVEAHRSTSLSVSMKRLSWITLIFLPPMFASSLFGMNVDVLAANPDWRWYPLFSVALLLITLVGWLTFKSFEPRAEQGLIRIGAEFNKRVRRGVTRTGSVPDIEMNLFS